MKAPEKVLGFLTDKMAIVAQVALIACATLVVVDVTKRAVVVGGILGTSEMVELIAAVILSMGVPHLTFVRGHVAVGLIVDRFRPRTRVIFDIVNSTISLAFVVWLTYAMFKFSFFKVRDGAVSGVLNIPIYPFCFVITAALVLTCVVFIRDLLKDVSMLRKGDEA